MKQGLFLNVVGRHGGYLGIIHGKELAIPIDAHTADAKLTGVDKAPPLANMAPHPAAGERLIEHRLPFHPSSLYHHELSQCSCEAVRQLSPIGKDTKSETQTLRGKTLNTDLQTPSNIK